MEKDVIEDDMLLLVDHCLYKESKEPRKRYEVKDFFEKNLPIFKKYSWPGNVRQLFSFVKRRLMIGAEEESELLNEINEDGTELKTNSKFMEDFQAVILKHRNNLPSCNSDNQYRPDYRSVISFKCALRKKTKRTLL